MLRIVNKICISSKKVVLFLAIFFILLLSKGSFLFAQPLKTADQPILITSAGQSPGGSIVKILCTQNKLSFDFFALATKDNLKGKEYKTIIFAIGSSLKGMGAAGISIKDELERIDALILEARKRNIILIGMHVEGEARRGGYDEDIIAKICPKMDLLLVREDGNKDGLFNDIASANKIPLKLVEKTLDFKEVLKGIFE